MQALIIKILDELRGSWRFRWSGSLRPGSLCLLGWAYVFAMPNVYEANARVYVDSQTALGPLLRGLGARANVESELSVVRQALLSRPQARSRRAQDRSRSAREDAGSDARCCSTRCRSASSSRPTCAQRTRPPTACTASPSRTTAARRALAVVETLLNTFVEETLGSKRTGQESAQRFLEEEIGELERRLTESEDAAGRIQEAQRRHDAGRGRRLLRAPADRDGGPSDVRKSVTLAESAARRIAAPAGRRGAVPVRLRRAANAPAPAEAGDITFRIQEMETRLEEMLLRYTEKHPEVIAVRTTIEELKKRQQEELARVAAGERGTGSMASSLKIESRLSGHPGRAEPHRSAARRAAPGSRPAQRARRRTASVWSIPCPRSKRSSRG